MLDPVKVEINAAFPGETVLIKLLDTYDKSRESMEKGTRDGWDKFALVLAKGWHNWWIDHGWPGEKV
jgi:hypothetical protein